jgi:HEPN domain-containing protein
MKDETLEWLSYADENLAVAKLALEHDHFNPCLQNCQQAVEKGLKAFIIEKDLRFERTHNIQELCQIISEGGYKELLSEEDSYLFDSIYVPSKYPGYGIFPDDPKNRDVCEKSIDISKRLLEDIHKKLGG